jgi:hypothetical protein
VKVAMLRAHYLRSPMLEDVKDIFAAGDVIRIRGEDYRIEEAGDSRLVIVGPGPLGPGLNLLHGEVIVTYMMTLVSPAMVETSDLN